jgi:hypothetical protein
MAYILPQVQVFQEIDTVPVASVQPRSAHIAGGHAQLIRYDEEDERVIGLLGQYDETNDEGYAWPQRPAGAVVDRSYTRVFVKDALLRYFSDESGDGTLIQTLSTSSNRLRAPSLNFKSNGAIARSAVFLDRDVQVGDAAKVRVSVDDVLYELCTYVAGFAPEVVASSLGADTADADNASTATLSGTTEQTGGDLNCLTLAVEASAYQGAAAGRPTETYTVRVLEGSVNGDLSAARVQVISASGEDDVPEFNPEGDGVYSTVSEFGLRLKFDVGATSACSLSAENDEVSADDLIAGQEWEVVVSSLYTLPTLTAGGTYSGAADDTYIIEVTTGGPSGTCKVTVRTAKGLDVSGPTVVTTAVAFAVGTFGVTATMTFSNGLVRGDKFYVPVTAASEGAIKTLILGHSLPVAVIDNGVTDVSLDLFIRKDLELTANRIGSAPLTNWEQSDTEITLQSGITATDESYTDDGDLVALPIIGDCSYSNVYVEARYWLPALSTAVYGITDVAELDGQISGPLHPDNPLKWGVFKALQNAGGSTVYYTAVCEPDDADSWLPVLDLIDGRRGVYGLVPLTRNGTVLSAYEAHVNSQSSETANRWRTLWINADAPDAVAIADDETSTDDAVLLAVLEDDPLTAGSQYTYLRVPAGNAAFVTNGVRAGDVARYQYGSDGFGNESYEEFVVDAVINEDTLRLVSGLPSPVNMAEKVEIWRNMTAANLAPELAKTAGFTNRRVKYVWPDEIDSDGYTTEGYNLCAALAGLASAVAPHQGLTRVEVAGFDNVDRTTRLFNNTQLNEMAEGGVWIVTQDPNGTIYTRHAVTTGDYDDLVQREEMLVRNLDSISFAFLDLYDPYIGRANVTDSALAVLRTETQSMIRYLTGANFVPRLGAQLIDGEIQELRQHATRKDCVVVALGLVLPYPLNNIDCHLKLVANIAA